MCCQDAVLAKLLLRNRTVTCLTYEKNTREPYNDKFHLFEALTLHFHGSQRLEKETSKIFNTFMKRMDRLNPNHFKGVHMNDFLLQTLLTRRILLHDIDFVDGNILREFAG